MHVIWWYWVLQLIDVISINVKINSSLGFLIPYRDYGNLLFYDSSIVSCLFQCTINKILNFACIYCIYYWTKILLIYFENYIITR